MIDYDTWSITIFKLKRSNSFGPRPPAPALGPGQGIMIMITASLRGKCQRVTVTGQ